MAFAWIRRAATAMAIGVALLFLIFVPRPEIWGWRLALFGALVGLAIYVACKWLDQTVGDFARRRQLLPGMFVAVPLYFLGGCLGLLAAASILRAARLMPFRLSGRDLVLVVLINGAISIVIGLLFHFFGRMQDQLRRSVERLKEAEFAEKELELARSIQSRLLPPGEISGNGYVVSARNFPARFVAGDFYDVFPLGDGGLGLVTADVSGKGIGAALIMASVKAVVPLVAVQRPAGETLTELNRRLVMQLSSREFVALCFARYDAAGGSLEIANAGLPDPYLISRDGVEALAVPGPRLPLGLRQDIAYDSLRVPIVVGQRVLFLTDGLPEAPTPSGEPLGYEELSRLVVAAAQAPGNLLDRLLELVRRATSEALEDDWTALLLERR
jgi:stage II sporulation SpoE-like protein